MPSLFSNVGHKINLLSADLIHKAAFPELDFYGQKSQTIQNGLPCNMVPQVTNSDLLGFMLIFMVPLFFLFDHGLDIRGLVF